MSFRQQATKLVGRNIRVQMHGHSLSGKLISVGSDAIVMRTRFGRRFRFINIPLASLIFFFLLF